MVNLIKKKEFHKIDVIMGQRVRSLRIQRGISQEQLGKHLGITFQQVQKNENGSNRIGTSRLFQIAQVFEMSMSHLVAGIESQFQTEPFEKPVKSSRRELEAARDFSKMNHVQQRAVHRIIKVVIGTEVD